MNESYLNTTVCLLCGETAKQSTIQKGYMEPDIFKIYHCEFCNTSFSMPRVSGSKVYELIYKNTEKIRGYCRYAQYQNKVLDFPNPIDFLSNSDPSYWGSIHALKSVLNIDRNARVLEVGSGLGYFTYSLKRAGYNIKGLDISKEAVEAAINKYGDFYICDDLIQYAQKNSEAYDVVIMTEVIEHLNEPKVFIEAIKQLIKPKGACILTTPNKSFYSQDVLWVTDAPPVHCWWFSEESIKFISKLFDMELKSVNFGSFYKKHSELYRITNLNNEGSSVFDNNGNVIYDEQNNMHKFRTPKWLKNINTYIKLRNYILKKKYPGRYMKGGLRSTSICAILIKN